ncbi:hypothetical protein O181_033556 [Austropuccinia psidii MF-1]|uniref:Uncharacterized protein n=1 Tax=Austropuccinia psidii MF-1 TaxID=1389203 RepID=A0A9Q3H773_9BASI|nr:hypothetical protein [Austropuccinia psidii MF-1]
MNVPTSVVKVSATTAHNTKPLFCDCADPTFLVMGVAQENRIYLHCPRKDPRDGWSSGCKFFVWLDDYALKEKLYKTPILVAVRPTFWEHIKVQTLDDVAISITATIGDSKDSVSSFKELEIKGTSKVDQARDLRGVIEIIDQTLSIPNKDLNLSVIMGRIRLMKRVLRTLAEDADLSALSHRTS